MVSLASFHDTQHCECGAPAERLISAPRVVSDEIAPTMGADGKMHTSMASYRHSLTPEGNSRGERYIEMGNEEGPKWKAPSFDRKKRRDDIRAGIQDVKEGRIPPPPVAIDI